MSSRAPNPEDAALEDAAHEDASAHEDAAHEVAAHEDFDHEGSDHEGSDHEVTAHEGSDHEVAAHEGADHEDSDHECSNHEGSNHEGSDSESFAYEDSDFEDSDPNVYARDYDSDDSMTHPMYSPSVIDCPATADWNLAISHSDFEKLRRGFRSGSHDDKWRIVRTSKENDVYTINFHRAGTGISFYILDISADYPMGNGPAIKSITWRVHPTPEYHLTDRDAKDSVVHIARVYMECELEGYPTVPWTTLWEIVPLVEAGMIDPD